MVHTLILTQSLEACEVASALVEFVALSLVGHALPFYARTRERVIGGMIYVSVELGPGGHLCQVPTLCKSKDDWFMGRISWWIHTPYRVAVLKLVQPHIMLEGVIWRGSALMRASESIVYACRH